MGFVLDDAGRTLDLLQSAGELKLLATLALHHKALLARYDIEGRLPELVSALHRLPQRVSDDRDFLASLGIDVDHLQRWLQAIDGRLLDWLPIDARRLLMPFERLARWQASNGPQRWHLQAKGAGQGTAADNVAFQFSAGGQSAVDIQTLDHEAVDVPSLLSIICSGQALAGAEVSAPFRFGDVQAGVKAAAALKLQYDYDIADAERDQLTALLLAERLPGLASPFSLASLWAAAGDGLESMQLTANTALADALAMQFNIAESFKPLSISGGFAFEVKTRRQRQYLVNVEQTGSREQPCLQVSVLRQRRSHFHSSSAVAIDLDLAPLISQLLALFVDRIQQPWQALLEDYGDFLQPGTLVRREFANWCQTKPELDQAWQLVVNQAGGVGSETVLTDALYGALDEKLNWLSQEAQQYSAELAVRLQQNLQSRYPELAANLPLGSLENLCRQLLGQMHAQLEGFARDKLSAGDAAIADLTSKLRAAAVDVHETIDNGLDSLDALLSGLREFIDRISQRLAAITAALADSARQRIQLRVYTEETRHRGGDGRFELEISANTSAAREVFAQLTRGDLGALKSLSAEGEGYRFDQAALAEFSELQQTQRLELALFGLEMGQESLFSSKVKVQRDLYGNVLLDASMQSSVATFGVSERQEATFFSQAALWSANQSRFMAAHLSVSQHDQDMQESELLAFLQRFVDADLLSIETLQRVQQQFALWSAADSDDLLKASVSVSLGLDGDRYQELLANAAKRGAAADRALIGKVLDALCHCGALTRFERDKAVSRLRNVTRRLARYEGEDVFLGFVPKLSSRRGARFDVRRAYSNFDFGDNLISPVTDTGGNSRLEDAVRMQLQIKGFAVLMATMAELAVLDPADANADDIELKHRLMNFCLRRWLRVSRRFLMLPSDEVQEETVAFFYLLAQQAGLLVPGEDSVLVTLQLPAEGDRPAQQLVF